MLKVRRDITWKSLQKEILLKMEDCICEEILSQTQKLSNLFMLRIYDGSSHKNYLPPDVDLPLYTQSAERAYTTLDEDFGPPHIKIIAEWDTQTKKTVVLDDKEHIEIHPSVTEAQINPPGQGKVSLDECFKLYTQEEKLIGDDAWLCPHCKQLQQGTIKTLRLWSLPDVLVLHLKRFKQTGLRRSKLNTLVEFPVENLDMSAHLTHQSHIHLLKRDDYCYDLLGVSNHYGNMMGGHYTAYCRSPVDGEWREFNDTKVRVLEGPIATREAYLLFYQRRSLSKEVNRRMFTRDHWVFSLPLAPSEIIEETSVSEETVPWNIELNHQPRRSRSRSASPSAHRQNNKDEASVMTRRIPTRPLTPQPFRRPMVTYIDDKDYDDDSDITSPPSPEKSNLVRRSRPVQRQASAPGSQFRREKSAGVPLSVKLKDPARALYNRRSLEVDQKDLALDQSKKSSKPELSNDVARSHSLSRFKISDKPPPVTVIRHDPPKSTDNDLFQSTSKTISHQALLSNISLESDAKYPTSSYDHTRYLDSRKVGISMFEPASALQVKYDDKDSCSSRALRSYYDSVNLSDAENARKKLSQLIKPEIIPRAHAERTHISIDPVDKETNFVRSGSRIYDTQKSLELARQHLVDVNISHTSTNGHSNRLDSFASDIRSRDIEFKYDRWYNNNSSSRRAGYSLLEEADDYLEDIIDFSPELPPRSDLKSKLRDETHYQGFRRLAENHFGKTPETLENRKDNYRPRFADDTEYRSSDYISPHLNGDLTRLNKYATISRTFDTSQAGRYERDTIPRSSTDHNIHYNNPSLAPPPSPTPPHSFREEQTFSQSAISTSLPSSTSDFLTSSRLSTREISSIRSYEFAGKHANNQDILVPSGIRTLPGYMQSSRLSKYNFKRPRGTWGVQAPKPAPKNLGSIPTPCLRESSV